MFHEEQLRNLGLSCLEGCTRGSLQLPEEGMWRGSTELPGIQWQDGWEWLKAVSEEVQEQSFYRGDGYPMPDPCLKTNYLDNSLNSFKFSQLWNGQAVELVDFHRNISLFLFLISISILIPDFLRACWRNLLISLLAITWAGTLVLQIAAVMC